MERKYLKNLENWYNDPFRKPMLIYGARQVGKTTLIKDIFAMKYFEMYPMDFNEYLYNRNRILYNYLSDSFNNDNKVLDKPEPHTR